jgi:outer membrane protein assembly factor BamD (BamD/ComL family)
MKPRLLLLSLAAGLVACSGAPKKPPSDDQPTLATLASRASAKVEPDPPGTSAAVSEAQTIAAYRKFLDVAPQAPQRPEALRRLGDLEMDSADRRAAEATSAAAEVPDYRAAIARYQDYLKAYPQDPRNDRVLYQLARAQEQGGQLEAALKTLTQLVQQHPGTVFADEAHFRRGELLFAVRDYKGAEAAYASVLAHDKRTPFHDRALYMQGWSLFKQARLEDALQPFLGVLDLKLGGLDTRSRDEPDLARVTALTRADRELVEDTFRVISISLSQLQGTAPGAPSGASTSVPPNTAASAEPATRELTHLMASPQRQGYHYRVVMQLADLYIRQERIKDAADTLAAFVRQQPLHPQAPLLQARVVDIYANAGFDTLALQAKKDHVQRYGAASEYRRASPAGWAQAQPLVKTHLAQLAQHHHALAQRTKALADVQEAVRWYREYLQSFPGDADALQSRFLLAELLFEDRQFVQAATEFETVAYSAPGAIKPSAFARAADAGYAALLSGAAQEKATAEPTSRTALQRQAVADALRFAQAFPADARAAAVLTNAAEQLYTLGEGTRASAVAQQALALQPPPAAELRRVAFTVVAHQAFETGAFAPAEAAYGEVLSLTPAGAAGRAALVERQAAAIYRQAEAARSAGDTRAAVGHFARINSLAALPAASALRATAQYDTAAMLLGLKDWETAAKALEDFRRQFAGHALQAEVAPKLALAYLELGRNMQAAAEFEKVANTTQDPAVARAALWQVAELHHQAAATAKPKSAPLATAINAWQRYLQAHPQPVEPAVQARWHLATLTQQDGQAARATAWTRAVQLADQQAGEARTPRTRTLGGQAALRLAEPVLAVYDKVPLIEPLQKQLKLKKARLEEVLAAYAAAAEVGVAEVTTAATFHTAALYQDFGRALLQSQRPKKLNKAEMEQYNVMLEEQAFPFEEKAIELYETNARRTTSGLYDTWVQRSLAALAKLKPVRYGKAERGDGTVAAGPQDVATLQARIDEHLADGKQPQRLNQLGVAHRQQGHFALARAAYEAAIELDPQAADPHFNLAILWDLYLGDVAKAQALYQRCAELSPKDAPVLGKWLAELKTRKPAPGAPAATAAAASPADAAAPAAPAPAAPPAAPTAPSKPVTTAKDKS